MFTEFLLRMGGFAAGMSSAQIDKVEAAMPAVGKLLRLANQAQPLAKKLMDIEAKMQPLVNEALPLIKEAMPLIQQAVPLVKEALIEWETIGPAVQIVFNTVSRDIAAGKSARDAVSGAAWKIQSAFRAL